MADNTILNVGTGGDTVGTDDIGGIKYQRVKLIIGADGVNDGDVASGNPLPVTGTITAVTSLTNALPAGTNNIGDVDVLSIIPGTGATNLGKAIDSIPGATDTGVVPLVVRDDALTTLTPADGDYTTMRTDSEGALWVAAKAGAAQVVDDAAFTPATTSVVMTGAEFDDTTPDSVDEGDGGALRMSANRNLYVRIRDNAGNERGLNIDSSGNATVNVTGTVTVASHAVTNAGTFAVQVDGTALTALQKIDDPVLVDDAAFTPATSSVMMAGFEADEASTDSVDEGDAGAARMTLDRKVIVTPQPHTAGGLTIFRSLDLDETEEDVKTSAGQIYAVTITNFATATRYIKFSNATAANTTVGTTAVFLTIPVPGNASDDTTLVQNFGGLGVPFDTALCAYATTALADNDTGAPAANDVAITVFYK
jgi:hypothetical protein